MKILECSSQGDRRFSALFAKVKLLGIEDTIENHYQGCKRNKYGEVSGKGKKCSYIVIADQRMSVTELTPFYNFLWCRYLDENPDLVEVLKEYDDYNDKFKRPNTINCQADSIRSYIRENDQFRHSFFLFNHHFESKGIIL